MTNLQAAAQAVIDRWDSPTWRDQPHTAGYIADLRIALEAEQAVEPLIWVRKDQLKQMGSGFLLSAYRSTEGRTDLTPLFTHPAPPATPTLKETLAAHGVKLRNQFEPKPLPRRHDYVAFKAECDREKAKPFNERAGLIAALRDIGYPECVDAAEMLEADGKPKNFLRLRGQLEQEWADVRALKEASKSKTQQVAVPVPMTDEQSFDLWESSYSAVSLSTFRAILREVETSHGIGAKP